METEKAIGLHTLYENLDLELKEERATGGRNDLGITYCCEAFVHLSMCAVLDYNHARQAKGKHTHYLWKHYIGGKEKSRDRIYENS